MEIQGGDLYGFLPDRIDDPHVLPVEAAREAPKKRGRPKGSKGKKAKAKAKKVITENPELAASMQTLADLAEKAQ